MEYINLKLLKEDIERRENLGFISIEITLSSMKELTSAVEALQERVVKLNGWLNEHECALAKLRREVNDANRTGVWKEG